MALLRAFRPLRYNPALFPDLARVVAPPYDVISPEQRDALYARSEYNVVRLILNRSTDPYAAAAEALAAWRRDRVLVRDTRAALCYHVESFDLPGGGARERSGVLGVVRLESFDSGIIRPHERTFARPKEDRLRLIRACHTNLSPIFGLFAGKQEEVLGAARSAAAGRRPDIELRDDKGVRHRLWMLADNAVVEAIAGALVDESIVIADGHHRYETALTYRDQLRAEGKTEPEAAHNFVLMYLTSTNDPGLVILPTHRVLNGLQGFEAVQFLDSLRRHFRLVPFERSANAEFEAALRQPPHRGTLGVALAGSDQLYVAALEDPSAFEHYARNIAPVVRSLDVTILDTIVLRGLLGVDCTVAAQEGRLTYTHDDGDALQAVDQGAQAAFLMNAPHIDDVLEVCAAGETMPQKSTYFFPKLLSGLVFHPFDDATA